MEEWGAERREGEGGGEVGWRRDVGQEQQGLTPERTSVHHKHREACLLVLHHSEHYCSGEEPGELARTSFYLGNLLVYDKILQS